MFILFTSCLSFFHQPYRERKASMITRDMMRNWKLIVGAVLRNMNSVDKNNLCILESVPDMKTSSLPRFMQLSSQLLCFFSHHVFNNFPLSSLFSKETKRACFSLPESRLGLWKMCQLKRTIKRLRIWRHWAPSATRMVWWCPCGFEGETYIS